MSYAYPVVTRLDRLMREDKGLPLKCWCTHERENVIQLRSKYEIVQRCSVCMVTV